MKRLRGIGKRAKECMSARACLSRSLQTQVLQSYSLRRCSSRPAKSGASTMQFIYVHLLQGRDAEHVWHSSLPRQADDSSPRYLDCMRTIGVLVHATFGGAGASLSALCIPPHHPPQTATVSRIDEPPHPAGPMQAWFRWVGTPSSKNLGYSNATLLPGVDEPRSFT